MLYYLQSNHLKTVIRFAEDVQKHEFRAENGEFTLFLRYDTQCG